MVTNATGAGSVTVFVLLFGPDLLVLTPLVALVGWARWRVGITVGTFWLMGVPVAFPRYVCASLLPDQSADSQRPP